MAYYMVSYDLRKEPDAKGYKALYDVLGSFEDWAWPFESVWIVSADSAKAIRSKLAPVLDNNDGLIVGRLTGELCYRRVKKGTPEWLDQRFTCA